jgi:hypothetical protein
MIPRETPLAGAAAAVLDKRKRETGGAEPAETVALAAGGRDLPARRCGTRRMHRGNGVAQDDTEAAAFAGRERKPARRHKIAVLDLGYDGPDGTAFERLLHSPQGFAPMRHAQDDEALAGEAQEIKPRPIGRPRFGGSEIGLDPHDLPLLAAAPGGRASRAP